MGVYYPGNGTVKYTGQDRLNRIAELKQEAQQHKKASDIYRGMKDYQGHMVTEGQDAIRKAEEAARMELDSD